MSASDIPPTGIEVIQVTYGERVTQRSAVLHGYAAYGLPDADLHMQYNYWVMRSGGRVILLDTGYDIPARDWLGELLVLVRARSGSLILAADAAHFYEQIENEWPFFAFTDLEEMRQALSFRNRLAAETGATVVPGHDGRVRERYPALDGPAAEVATVLG